MNIPKKKLCVIGLSIKVNRKARLKNEKSSKWTQAQFANDICSQNTLINVEKGKPARFVEYYAKFAMKLGLTFSYYPEIDEHIQKLSAKLYKAIEFYESAKIEKYADALLKVLEPSKNALWYCDVYKFVRAVKAYYIQEALLDALDIDYYTEMVEELPDKCASILKSLVFNTVYNDVESNAYESIFTTLRIKEDAFVCNEFNVLMYYNATDKVSKFLKQLYKMEIELTEKKNYVRLMDAYSYAITFLACCDASEVHLYIEKFENLINANTLLNYQYMRYYYALGVACYVIGSYVQSIYYMNRAINYDENHKTPAFIFMAGAQRKVHEPICIPDIPCDKLESLSADIKYIYEYFKMEYSAPSFVRQKFLMEEILPRLILQENLVIEIIKDELRLLISDTNHYKDLTVFDTKMGKLLSL